MEKLHIRDQSYSAAPVCIYKYDQTGNIVNSNVTFYGMPASPMKYRDIRSRRSEIPRKLRSPSIPRSYPDLTFRSKLDVNMYNREVFVIRDGTYVQDKDKVQGFHYKFSLIQKFDRASHSEEMKVFFRHCSKNFHTGLNFKFLFDSTGKLLRCLHELNHEGKIVLVGTKPGFQGLRHCKNVDFESEPGEEHLRYVAMEKLNSAFRIKTCKSRNSSYQERVTPAKIHKKTDEKIPFDDLKVKLGNVSYNIDRTFPTLCSQGIQKIKSKYNFNEKELHNLYGKFKLLVLLSCGIDKDHKIESGISKNTFVDYYSKSPELSHILSKIFDKFDLDGGGTVSWEEFLEAMNVIWHGTIEDQLDFFFAVYDNDGNGRLSFNEIQELCRLQLQMEKADNLLDELSYSFASLIFDLTETSYDEDIPSDKIKEIIRKQQDKSLIEMFCSFNCLK